MNTKAPSPETPSNSKTGFIKPEIQAITPKNCKIVTPSETGIIKLNNQRADFNAGCMAFRTHSETLLKNCRVFKITFVLVFMSFF